jgi:transcriptional regulator with XRE-family HTH domain
MAVRLTAEQCQRIRSERERAGLTQVELADRLGVVSQLVNMIENGKRAPPLETLQRIGEVLGLEITVETIVTIKRKRRS